MKILRKVTASLVIITILSNLFCVYSATTKSPKVFLNNKEIVLESSLVTVNNVILAPYKKLSEKMNLWIDIIDAENYKGINIFNGQKNLYFMTDSPLACTIKISETTKEFYAQYFQLENNSRVINGKVYLPLKNICQILGYTYSYDKTKNIIYISGKVLPKITETNALKKWCKKEEVKKYLEKYTNEITESAKNILNYALVYENVGKNIWLNSPGIKKYSYILSDSDGNILPLKNLSKYKLTDIRISKSSGNMKSTYYNSKIDKIATNYILQSENNKFILTLTNNDYKVDALPAYLEDYHKKFNCTNEIWTSIENGEVINGMNPSQVLISIGEPDDTKFLSEDNVTYEGWYYSDKEVYFENGKVVDVKKVD